MYSRNSLKIRLFVSNYIKKIFQWSSSRLILRPKTLVRAFSSKHVNLFDILFNNVVFPTKRMYKYYMITGNFKSSLDQYVSCPSRILILNEYTMEKKVEDVYNNIFLNLETKKHYFSLNDYLFQEVSSPKQGLYYCCVEWIAYSCYAKSSSNMMYLNW